jgi:hypothetical protein
MRSLSPYVVGLFLLALSATPAFAASSSAADAARAEHDRIVRYWTPARLAAAQPRDFVRSSTGFQPYAGKPGGGGGAVTGASWTGGGKITQAEGMVSFHMDGGDWQCSGTVATDSRNTYSLVLTAGHCAYDETNGGGQPSGFATNWVFIPAWDEQPATFSTRCGNSTKYGCWTATALVVDSGFATAGGFNDQATHHDFAFAVVAACGYANAQLDVTAGSFAYSKSAISKGSNVYAFGFPAAGKYHGNDLTYCAGKTIEDQYNDNSTWGLPCDMTGGSSGGAWLGGFDGSGNTGTLGSLNSYGYSGIKNMYGPKFNSNTDLVYSNANSRTANYIVPVTP